MLLARVAVRMVHLGWDSLARVNSKARDGPERGRFCGITPGGLSRTCFRKVIGKGRSRSGPLVRRSQGRFSSPLGTFRDCPARGGVSGGPSSSSRSVPARAIASGEFGGSPPWTPSARVVLGISKGLPGSGSQGLGPGSPGEFEGPRRKAMVPGLSEGHRAFPARVSSRCSGFHGSPPYGGQSAAR